MTTNWQNYIPTHRIFDEAEEIDYADSMKEKTGSKKNIYSPLEVLLINTSGAVMQGETNKVKLKIARLARMGSFGDLISEEDFRQGHEPAITYKENGKIKYLAVTQSIKQAVDSLTGSREQSNFVMAAINAATALTRATLTSGSLDFASGNPIRDAQEAYLYNKQGSLNPYYLVKNICSTMWRVFTGMGKYFGMLKHGGIESHPLYLEWLAHGGSQATMVTQDMNQVEILLDDMTKTNFEKWFGRSDENAAKRIRGFFGQILRSMQEFSELTENSTRLAVYENVRNRLAEKTADGKVTEEIKNEAALASRNATIDFARSGSTTRKINQKVAFFNAVVQDWDKTARLLNPAQLTTKEGRKNLLDTIFRLGIGTFSMALLQAAATDDKDWYKYGVQDWQKDTSWILGENFKIPKSYSLLNRLTAVIAEDIFSNAPVEGRRYVKTFTDALPSVLPTIITPAVEAATNYSFFYGGPILPQKEQRLPSHMQYNEKTSEFAKFVGGSEIAKKIGEIFLGDNTGFSPRKIDHMISSYFGFPGKLTTGGIDYVKRNIHDGKEYSFNAAEFPITKRFIYDPYKNPQIVVDYYNERSKQEKLYNEYKQTKKKPDGYDEKLYKKLKANEKAMKNLSDKERKLIANEKIPAEKLKAEIRALEKKRIEICKRAFGKT